MEALFFCKTNICAEPERLGEYEIREINKNDMLKFAADKKGQQLKEHTPGNLEDACKEDRDTFLW